MKSTGSRALQAEGYLLLAFGSALLSMVLLPLTLAVAVTVVVGGLGFWLLPRWMRLLRRWAALQQRWAAQHLGTSVPEVPEPDSDGFRTVWSTRANRRVLLWLPAFTATGLLTGLLGVVVLGLALNVIQSLMWWVFPAGAEPQQVGVAIASWPVALAHVAVLVPLTVALTLGALVPVARVHARACMKLLAPSEAELLSARVDELSRTRADVVDAHGAELRRIERDLHDGTQARLVAIAMQLGVAREAMQENPRIATLLDEAHRGTEEAMAELRDVIRGIYPPILADRGLGGALTALAARTAVPTRMDVDELGELPVATETAAYFVVTEAVANSLKYSGAESILVRLRRREAAFRVSVHDDGSGGVDEAHGSGITGIRRRVAALDGTVHVDSPEGGPTRIEVDLPYGA